MRCNSRSCSYDTANLNTRERWSARDQLLVGLGRHVLHAGQGLHVVLDGDEICVIDG